MFSKILILKRQGEKNNGYNDFFIDEAKELLSKKTIKEHYVFLHAVMEMAIEEEIIDKNPMKKGQKPKVEKAEADYYTPEDIEKILEALDREANMGIAPHKWQAFMYLLIYTGARRGEITGLTWDSIDFVSGEMTISQATSYSAEKKAIRPCSMGIEFVGYRVWATHRKLKRKTALKVRHAVKGIKKKWESGAMTQEAFDRRIASYKGVYGWVDSANVTK